MAKVQEDKGIDYIVDQINQESAKIDKIFDISKFTDLKSLADLGNIDDTRTKLNIS